MKEDGWIARRTHVGRRAGLFLRYGFALLSVAGMLGVRSLLHPYLGEWSPLLPFVLSVLLASWFGGWGPGLLATALSSVAANYFFMSPGDVLRIANLSQLVQLCMFWAVGLTVSSLNHYLTTAGLRLREGNEALRQSEERFRLLSEDLEKRVEERTRELLQANQALEAFGYSVSHDLRAPLRGIQGFADALLEDYGERLDEMGIEYARRIAGAAARMDGLIQDLLAYSRLSRVEIVPQRVDLSPVLDEARSQLDGGGSFIRVDGPLPAVQAHRLTLVQVLANLLSNALKFVPEGGTPDVRVWSERRDGRVRLWIEDHGIGIAPEHQERIFSVFERLHGGEAYPGTGIGLAIVRKGVERMGGRSGVESAAGRGSKFWIDLPPAEEGGLVGNPHDPVGRGQP